MPVAFGNFADVCTVYPKSTGDAAVDAAKTVDVMLHFVELSIVICGGHSFLQARKCSAELGGGICIEGCVVREKCNEDKLSQRTFIKGHRFLSSGGTTTSQAVSRLNGQSRIGYLQEVSHGQECLNRG